MSIFAGSSLTLQFQIASLVVLLTSGVALGLAVEHEIEEGVLHRAAAIAALYLNSVVSPALQSLVQRDSLEPSEKADLDRLLTDSVFGERIVALKVWSPDGTILYSPNAELVGQSFPIDHGLSRALQGGLSAELSNLDDEENLYERGNWSHLLEVYIPIRQDVPASSAGGRIIAVTEFYQSTDQLDRDIADARWRSWGVVAAIILATYLLLNGIVRRGSGLIQRQDAALRQRIQELSALQARNSSLHDRVRTAAQRTTTLNEQSLRRISADLHDGPCQSLAFGLLRLGTIEESLHCDESVQGDFRAVHRAVHDALDETRTIASDLRLPRLAGQSLQQVAQRTIEDHERRAQVQVQKSFGPLPASCGVPIKIAVARVIQEALSNATRHAGGRGLTTDLRVSSGALVLIVSDEGPGFDPNAPRAREQLGLSGMRERAELLGGEFNIKSSPGNGTTVLASWPMYEVDELRLDDFEYS